MRAKAVTTNEKGQMSQFWIASMRTAIAFYSFYFD